MGLDLDIKSFIEDMKACKPPYRCPFDDCGKVYKTFSGINSHIQSHADSAGPADGPPPRSPSPQPFFKSPVKESLLYNEATKKVEFEAEGRLHRFSIYDALELVDKKEWEATLPTSALLADDKPEEEAVPAVAATPKTPVVSRVNSKKKKTPKSKPPATAEVEKEAAGKDSKDPNDKKMLKLPEAQFREIDDYEIDDAPLMPSSYYRFIEKPAEELDEEVEYDMDEEDVAWLDIINEKRSNEGLQEIKEEQFELLMDRLEKESYFHVQTNGKDGYTSAPIDEDAICCVCMDGECSNTNVILFCDLCNLAVHQECYGVPYIPEGQWLCRRCLQSPSRSVDCCLCPNKGGAFKQTDDGRWAHVVCGLWIPEVRFANTVFLEPIDSIDNIPPARWKLSCRVCKQRGVGACIQCHKTNCYTAFHVTCGLLAGLHMKMDTVRESSAAGLSVTVRKTAYCDVHTPQDSDCKPQLDDVASLGISTPKQKARSPKKLPAGTGGSPVPVLFRGLMNFSPQCPWEKVQEIASLIQVQKKNQFFQRLMAYWTLKRQTRNGVPLIRRLQFAKAMRADKAPETPQKNAHHNKKKKDAPAGKEEKAGKATNSVARKAKDDFKVMLEQRKHLRRLRQDLERVRLLCELIRKREQRKRELIGNMADVKELQCWPFICFLRNVMDSLQEVDQQEIFAEPVSLDDVPDYLEHIKTPMDFTTMRQKLHDFSYGTVDELESDFNLMVENCLSYNERDTIFFRAGVKMRDVGGSIIRQARRSVEAIGFDGFLHAANRAAPPRDEVSDDQAMKEIDNLLNSLGGEDMPDEVLLKKLLELQDKAQMLHHPMAKVRRLKLLRAEITKIRRKLTLDKTGNTPGVKPKKEDGDAEHVKKKKTREVSPVSVTEDGDTPGRRLRAGREPEKKPPGPAAKKGKKRARLPSSDGEGAAAGATPPQRKRPSTAEEGPKTPVKAAVAAASSPAKSPAGVNRRNAVLFTRKKQAAATPAAGSAAEEKEATPRKGAVDGGDLMEEEETEVQTGGKPAANDTEASGPPAVTPASPKKPKEKKKRGRKPRSGGPSVELEEDDAAGEKLGGAAGPKSPTDDWQQMPPKTASFQEYRRGGEVGETDEDTQSESATDALVSDTSDSDSDDSDTDSDDSSAVGASHSSVRIPLEPLDLVWAKCRGYPWYPALIINPKMPRTGYLHNGVPIPVPPQEVLDMAQTHTQSHYLILFFDAKRTWQWLVRDKLEPLGVDSELDKAKLVQSKKPGERKAVKKAYEDAIMHRCKVTGENASISEESSQEEEEKE